MSGLDGFKESSSLEILEFHDTWIHFRQASFDYILIVPIILPIMENILFCTRNKGTASSGTVEISCSFVFIVRISASVALADVDHEKTLFQGWMFLPRNARKIVF